VRAGWALLWTERLRRDLASIYRLVACRRGRHRDAHLLADDIIGSQLADDYPSWPSARPAAERSTGQTGKPSIEAW